MRTRYKMILGLCIWVISALILWYAFIPWIRPEPQHTLSPSKELIFLVGMLYVSGFTWIFSTRRDYTEEDEEEEPMKSTEEYLQSIDKKLDKLIGAHGGVK